MKGLTIIQPYADLIARGAKRIENRRWATGYRGELLIHAGKAKHWLEPDDIADNPSMAFGAIVAVARVTACHRLERLPLNLRDDPHANGPWCWILDNVTRLHQPVPCRGAQALWDVPPDVLMAVRRQVGGRV